MFVLKFDLDDIYTFNNRLCIYKLLYFVFNTGVARIFQHGGGGGGEGRKAQKDGGAVG